MAKLLPKKELDMEVLKQIIKYYRIDPANPEWDPEEFLEWECFSHPSLELHECNCRARLPGGHKCLHCDHVVGRPCPISCDFQTFCLAVFAWRMEIGGSDFRQALEHNLYTLRPQELYEEVIKKFSLGDAVQLSEPSKPTTEPSFPDEKVAIDSDFINNEELIEIETKTEQPVATEAEMNLDELLSIKEAADIYGCTYANIYNYVKEGRLSAISKGRRMFVKRADLIAFKERPRRNLKKK